MAGWIRHSIHNVLALTLCTVLSPGAASAQDFEDPVSIAWKFGFDLSDATYHALWEDNKNQGYLPIQIEMDDGGDIYSGVWQKNTDGRGWASWRRLTSDPFHEKWDEFRKKGYRPLDQSSEVIGGSLLYSLVMVENKEGLDWVSNRNLTSEQFYTRLRWATRDPSIGAAIRRAADAHAAHSTSDRAVRRCAARQSSPQMPL